MGRAPGFITLEDVPFVPNLRADEASIHNAAIKPATVNAIWNNAPPTIISRWAESLASDVSTARDGTTPTPGFTVGDAILFYSFVKLDRLVLVRLYFEIASNTRINTLTKDTGNYKRTGDRGTTYLKLPYRVSLQNAAQFGIYTRSYSNITGAGAVVHASQSAYTNLPPLAPGATELNLFGGVGDWDVLPGGPLAYDAAAPLAIYWSTGDSYNLQYQYETDEI